jgi:hypothetical protein
MNRMLTIQRSPSSASSLEEPTQRMSFDEQQVFAIQDVEFRCQTEASFPCSTFRLSDKIAKALSQRHFERLVTLDIIDDPAHTSEEPEYFDTPGGEPDYYEDLVERSHEEEAVLILGLDLLEIQPDNSHSGDGSSCHSFAEDSLKVTKRRMTKKKKSQMKTLSDFRRSFARQCRQASLEDSDNTADVHESPNTTSPPCAWRR